MKFAENKKQYDKVRGVSTKTYLSFSIYELQKNTNRFGLTLPPFKILRVKN